MFKDNPARAVIVVGVTPPSPLNPKFNELYSVNGRLSIGFTLRPEDILYCRRITCRGQSKKEKKKSTKVTLYSELALCCSVFDKVRTPLPPPQCICIAAVISMLIGLIATSSFGLAFSGKGSPAGSLTDSYYG